jgi:hypothetical protein
MAQITEQEYFDQTVQKVLTQIGCTMQIDITIMDHDTLTGKDKEALGICWRNEIDNTHHITIDEFFVHECYTYFIENSVCSTWELNGKTLEYVICHELAHIEQWNHCKKHREITNELLSMVTLPEKYHEYFEEKYSIIA